MSAPSGNSLILKPSEEPEDRPGGSGTLEAAASRKRPRSRDASCREGSVHKRMNIFVEIVAIKAGG